MSLVYEFMGLLFSHFVLRLVLAGGYENKNQGDCPSYLSCGYLGNISFPFTTTQRRDCGLLPIHYCHDVSMKPKTIQFPNKGKQFDFEVEALSPTEYHGGNATCSCVFRDMNLYKLLQNKSCEAFRYNYTLPLTPHLAFHLEIYTSLFMCNRSLHVNPPTYGHNYTKCPFNDFYYQPHIYNDKKSWSAFTACANVRLPIKDVADSDDPFTFVTADMAIQVNITSECAYCHYTRRGRCQLDSKGRFYCANGILKRHPGNTNTYKCTELI